MKWEMMRRGMRDGMHDFERICSSLRVVVRGWGFFIWMDRRMKVEMLVDARYFVKNLIGVDFFGYIGVDSTVRSE